MSRTLTDLVLPLLPADRDRAASLRDVQDACNASREWSAYVTLTATRERLAQLETRGLVRCVPKSHPKFPSWYKVKP